MRYREDVACFLFLILCVIGTCCVIIDIQSQCLERVTLSTKSHKIKKGCRKNYSATALRALRLSHLAKSYGSIAMLLLVFYEVENAFNWSNQNRLKRCFSLFYLACSSKDSSILFSMNLSPRPVKKLLEPYLTFH